jgi:hypothetical protein
VRRIAPIEVKESPATLKREIFINPIEGSDGD